MTNERVDNSRNETVKDLVDQHTHSRNYTKIQEFCSAQIAVGIFKLRIPIASLSDQMIWNAKPRGVCSVRSAYRLLKNMKCDPSEG